MADKKNKVEFGISNLYVGEYTEDEDGTVTLGAPYHQYGTTTLSIDPEGDSNEFYADNTKYWNEYMDNGFSGTLTVAKFDDEFKTKFLGFVKMSDGGIAKLKTAIKPKVYIAFQAEGDVKERRSLLLNVTLGGIKREYATVEDKKTPATESVDITVNGSTKLGLTQITYNPEDAGYKNLFTTPTIPTIATGSGGA